MHTVHVSCNTYNMFDQSVIDAFGKSITEPVTTIMTRSKKEYVHETTYFGNDSDEYVELMKNAFHVRQIQMKEGDVAQTALGLFPGWEDLGIGHESGLDIRRLDNSIIIELKNKWNTCNSGSQKAILDKLASYKEKHPDTVCVWGIINAKPDTVSLSTKINHNGQEIMKIQGVELFKLVCVHNEYDYTSEVIDMVKHVMYHSNPTV